MSDQDDTPEAEILQTPPEYTVDLDELHAKHKDTQHNWVERGLIVSCEGAGHPNHRHYLVGKR